MTRPAAAGPPAVWAVAWLLLLPQLTEARTGLIEPETTATTKGHYELESQSSYFETASRVSAEVRQVTADTGRRIWAWIFGRAGETGSRTSGSSGGVSEGESGGGGDAVSAGPAGPDGPLLTSFCGMEIVDGKTVDCSCCADHLISSPVEASALLYGGQPNDKAPAFHRNDTDHAGRSGRVRVWTLGSMVPSIWCDRGLPICRCEDPGKSWHVSEPACRTGAACAPPIPPEETSSTPQKDTLPQPPQGTPGCAGGLSIPIGSARCEDMSVRQCPHLYARVGDGWHYCQVDTAAVRTCGAKLSDETRTKEQEEQRSMAWAAQIAYNPSLNWTAHEQPDHTIRVVSDPLPPIDQVRAILSMWGQSPPPDK